MELKNKRGQTIMCAYDPNRVCNDTCAAFIAEDYSVMHTPYYDKSDATPQFKWKKARVFQGPTCGRGGQPMPIKETAEEVTDQFSKTPEEE
jgi:hypothetical protein